MARHAVKSLAGLWRSKTARVVEHALVHQAHSGPSAESLRQVAVGTKIGGELLLQRALFVAYSECGPMNIFDPRNVNLFLSYASSRRARTHFPWAWSSEEIADFIYHAARNIYTFLRNAAAQITCRAHLEFLLRVHRLPD